VLLAGCLGSSIECLSCRTFNEPFQLEAQFIKMMSAFAQSGGSPQTKTAPEGAAVYYAVMN